MKQLLPIELGGVNDKDLELEGKALDNAQQSAETLLSEMFPDLSYLTIYDWERVYGLTPWDIEPLQNIRDKVIRKMRELGGLDKPYFIALAQAVGYTIEIDDITPFMAGWGRAGDAVYVVEAVHVWRVRVFSGHPVYLFRAGTSAAGEKLGWWDVFTDLETLLNDLKPAHTSVIFQYI